MRNFRLPLQYHSKDIDHDARHQNVYKHLVTPQFCEGRQTLATIIARGSNKTINSSIDPQLQERDAVDNVVAGKYAMGERAPYQRFTGKDWQGRSLSLGNLANRIRYLSEGGGNWHIRLQ